MEDDGPEDVELDNNLLQFINSYYNLEKLPNFIHREKFTEFLKDKVYDLIMDYLEEHYDEKQEFEMYGYIDNRFFGEFIIPFIANDIDAKPGQIYDNATEGFRRFEYEGLNYEYGKKFISPFIKKFKFDYFVEPMVEVMNTYELFDVNVAIFIAEFI